MLDGEPIKGELHSADASAGVKVKLYNQGSLTERVLVADEYVEVHSIQLLQAAAGDGHVFVGADATPGAGETIVRGTFAANGGIERSRLLVTGQAGNNVFVVTPAGAVDVIFNGVIRKERTTGRPTWRESQVPGH